MEVNLANFVEEDSAVVVRMLDLMSRDKAWPNGLKNKHSDTHR
jgi:hypothetical protein